MDGSPAAARPFCKDKRSETMEKMKVWLGTFLSVGMERLLTAALILVGVYLAERKKG